MGCAGTSYRATQRQERTCVTKAIHASMRWHTCEDEHGKNQACAKAHSCGAVLYIMQVQAEPRVWKFKSAGKAKRLIRGTVETRITLNRGPNGSEAAQRQGEEKGCKGSLAILVHRKWRAIGKFNSIAEVYGMMQMRSTCSLGDTGIFGTSSNSLICCSLWHSIRSFCWNACSS